MAIGSIYCLIREVVELPISYEKKGILGLYDLKTVYGKGSVETQLLDSIGQTNRVL